MPLYPMYYIMLSILCLYSTTGSVYEVSTVCLVWLYYTPGVCYIPVCRVCTVLLDDSVLSVLYCWNSIAEHAVFVLKVEYFLFFLYSRFI